MFWKLLTSIIDGRMKESLHGFRAKRGTGTAIFEAKLFQQLAAIEQVPVFEVFLDLKKAYDTLDHHSLKPSLVMAIINECPLSLLSSCKALKPRSY